MKVFESIKSKVVLIAILFCSLCVCSCSKAFEYVDDNLVKVVLVEDNRYEVLNHDQNNGKNMNIALLPRGEDVTFHVKLEANLYIESTNNNKATILFTGVNEYDILVHNADYSMNIVLNIDIIGDNEEYGLEKHIAYDPNGGSCAIENYRVPYSTAHHPRPNTSMGVDIMSREGYTLVGWNTKPDGSGEHIGLGSRYLDPDNYVFTLYAEWKKQSESSLFDFFVSNSSINITKYLGDEEIVCVPRYIGSYVVKTICTGAFKDVSCKSIILPVGLNEVQDGSFVNCSFTDLYMFDDLLKISDNAFVNCNNFKTLHINAATAPRYIVADRNVTYADKIDYLMLNKNKKKFVIMGGSGAYYNVNADHLHEAYPDYEACNVAVNGFFSGRIQFEIAMHFIGNDDIFLHVVESVGIYQFMTTNDFGQFYNDKGEFDTRFMNCFECNYDLITLFDIRHINHVFDVFATFSKGRSEKEPKNYNEYTKFATKRGDYSSDPEIRIKQQVRYGRIIQADEAGIDCDAYSDTGLSILLGYYNEIFNKGGKVFFSHACVNRGALSEEDLDEDNINSYEQGLETKLKPKVKFLTNVRELIKDVELFSDTDWHLDYENSIAFTDLLIERMGQL